MWLWYVIGAVVALSLIVSAIERIKKIPIELAEKKRAEELAKNAARDRLRCEELKAEAVCAMEVISREKALGFPWLATAYSEYQKLYDLKLADHLENKRFPAKRAAEHVRAMAAEKAALRRENRILRESYRYYENIFPWLIDFKGEDLDELIRQAQERGTNEDEDEDPAAQWLTGAEKHSPQLTRAEKYQRALDRYWQSKKAPWQIGRDYERYIGYKHEREGFKVEYSGIEFGLEDLGRDLVCRKGRDVRIVQCKLWGRHKTLHEKHVCQIFGTATAYRVKVGGQQDLFGDDEITPWLYAACNASPTAKEFAVMLGVKLLDNFPLDRYPIIKCNVSLQDGGKIYHLPFDQQYDRTLIEYKDERYVGTVAEAEALGFRRAFRWRGNPEG
jgi:hypothetical protein